MTQYLIIDIEEEHLEKRRLAELIKFLKEKIIYYKIKELAWRTE